MKAIMNESLTIPESVVCAGLFLVAMLVIAAALIGYFKGLADGLRKPISVNAGQLVTVRVLPPQATGE